MKLLVDMCLSPRWAELLTDAGFTARHWADVGDPRANDRVILGWAREHDWIVFTHDLDFARLLALTHATGPSVVQVRADDVLPDAIGSLVVAALRQHAEDLRQGSLLVVEPRNVRARILPLRTADPPS